LVLNVWKVLDSESLWKRPVAPILTEEKKRNTGGSAETNSRLGTSTTSGKIPKQTASQLQSQIGTALQKGNAKKAVKEVAVFGAKLNGAPVPLTKKQIILGPMQANITKSTKNSAKALNKKGVFSSAPTNVNDVGDGDGEWKTVITKKQKQKQPTDSLIQAVAEVAAAIGVNGNDKSINSSIPTRKKLNAKKTKSFDHTAMNSDIAHAPFTPSTTLIASENNTENDIVTFQPEIVQQSLIVADNKASEIVPTDIIPAASQSVNDTGTNLAFDDLGDAVWTESKPQKKNKKRALRE